MLFSKLSLLLLFPLLLSKEVPASTNSLVNNHPFFVSVVEIEHNTNNKSLEVSCKFFTDDFEQTIEHANRTSLDINSANYKSAFDKFIPFYINQHLALAVDGKQVKMNYVGYEVDKESVYCYFEVPNVAKLKNLDANNNLLYDFNKDQINIMHVMVNGKRVSKKLNNPDSRFSFQF